LASFNADTLEIDEELRPMDFSADISRFSTAAQRYCAWLEATPGAAAQEHFNAIRLIAELYAAALSLPGTEPTSETAPSLSQEQRNSIRHRLKSFPFQYYWEVFEPIADAPHNAVCADITDDLAGIYFDVKEGLLAYPTDEQGAVWYWTISFGFHWGRHATSALRALHSYDPESAE
jgi:hypothetical protein